MRKRVLCYTRTTKAQISLHPRSLISAFVIRCLDSVMSVVSVTKISSLMLAVAAQAGLCLDWSETPDDRFSRDEAQLYPSIPHSLQQKSTLSIKHFTIYSSLACDIIKIWNLRLGNPNVKSCLKKEDVNGMENKNTDTTLHQLHYEYHNVNSRIGYFRHIFWGYHNR